MRDRLTKALQDAVRAKSGVRVSTIRLMLAAIKDREIALKSEDGPSEMTDAEAFALLGRMIKQREESIRSYEQAGRMELAEQERGEIEVIREFLPRPLSEEEAEAAIQAAIARTGASSIRDMGRVMGELKARHAGQLDFGKVGAQVKAALG